MEQIKVVRIIARLNIGGPAINVYLLSSLLDKAVFSTKVIHGQPSEKEGSLERLLSENGIAMELVPELGRDISIFDDFKAFWKIFAILRRERPDIVHTHTAKAGTLGRLAAALAGVKVRIHTFHGHVFRHYFGKFKTAFFILIERALGLITDKIIALSPKQKDDLVNEFSIVPERKCEIIPLGIDFDRLRRSDFSLAGLKDELKIEKDCLLIGMVGRLVPIKNHMMFLEAVSEIRKKRPDSKTKYAIIGDGELRPELEKRAASLGIDDIVYFLGWREDLGNIYKSLDIVALTSLNEGTPVALIEAMASGRPVIATDVGGVSDVVDNGVSGILTEKADLDGFVRGLISLIEDPALRERLGREGLKKSVIFSKEDLARSIAALYKKCMEEKR